MRLLDRLRRHREPDPLDHDTDWHGELDDVRQVLDARRTRRLSTSRRGFGTERVEFLKPCNGSTDVAADKTHADTAERGQTSGSEGE